MFHMCALIPRIASHQTRENVDNDYIDVAINHRELRSMKEQLMSRITDVMIRANKVKTYYTEYAYLWTDSRAEYMNYFLTYGRQLTADEVDALEEDEKAVKKQYPSLALFQEQIDFYEKLHESLKSIDIIKIIQSWLRLDIKPFKTSLLNNIKRWSYVFKKHLMNHVVKSLGDLNDFIEKADEGLMTQVQEDDYHGLIRVMEFLQTVKERQNNTDSMFEPLVAIIEVLRNYGVAIPEESLVQLQELPEKWNNTKRLSVIAIQQVSPLQAMEVGRLKKRIGEFDVRQADFRTTFLKMRFYVFKCRRPYDYLSQANISIEDYETHMRRLQESASLFEVTVPEFRLLQICRKETKMLKQLWDYIFLVQTNIDDWKTTTWKDIDVENMDMDCKKFSKDIRGLDKEMRTWDVFNGLEVTVKNMLTSLRAVGELQNPAIRDRHWQQLVIATRVNFIMSEETTLANLLELNLHNFEDDVHNIVDKAIKEMAMERMLKELEVIWSAMEFLHENHARTGYNLLRTSEELIETLEENQVQIQNMMTSKYISFFIDEISTWQKRLSIVDTVISLWFDVQRTWSHLESIFIGSEDIRKQLPVDSNRFDDIDEEFKLLMKQMANTSNVIRATNVPGLAEKLEMIQAQLSLCENALAEYLEAKRLAFPRFYFASSNDLLDILSNGNQPIKVAKHLTKLFDSMAKLKLRNTGKDIETLAYAMIAKDGEEVEFPSDCVCEGQVEVWLNRLMFTMRQTIRSESLTFV
jgi:dynein heavy chain